MRKIGEYLGLKVPGLAEGRPSVLIGDRVMLTDPGDPDGPCYEGCVHEVRTIIGMRNIETHIGGFKWL